MKKYIVLFFIILLILAGSFFTFRSKMQIKPLTTADNTKIWVLSDPHFIHPDLYDDGSAFQRMQETSAGKELLHQTNSWQSLLSQAKQEQPDYLIVTGDLTFNGEYDSAEALSHYFAELEALGIQVFVIPGNHDIHDGWARKFEADQQIVTKQISPHDFRKLFATSYDAALAKDENSLSYIVQGTNDVRFFFLDTNLYPFETSRRQPATGGAIKDESLRWLETQLEDAEKAQQTPLIFMHHNLFKHNEYVYKGYVLNNAEDVQRLFAHYQIPLVFSGHIHAQDILQEDNIIEVTTGSFAIAPQSIGELQLEKNHWRYTRQELDTKNQPTPKGFSSYQDYLKDFLLQDGKRFAYGQMIEQGIYDSDQLDAVAEVVGEAHVRYFTGNDYLSNTEIQQLEQSPGYQLLEQMEIGSLLNYLTSIQQDTNLPDDQLELTYTPAKQWQIVEQN